MIRTYIKIAFRNFIKDKFFSVINTTGLAVGIAVVLLIALYVVHETSYDRFHTKADRIYRIAMHLEMGGNAADLTSTFPPLAKAIKSDVPEVEEALRLYSLNGKAFKQDDRIFTEDNVLFSGPEFFKVFDFKVLAGNPATALQKPHQVLLTPALVEKYFRIESVGGVIGESIYIDQQLYEVTGVVEEAPANSHFHFTAIASIESTPQGRDETWNNMNLSTYLLLDKNASIGSVMAKLPAVFAKNMPNFEKMPEKGVIMQPMAQPLTDIHLHSNIQGEFEPTGSITTLYVFGSVACIVLLLACVNFVNLITARSANRAKEVGVRKVLGSASHQLIRQFTLESIAVVFVATLFSLGLVELLRRPFDQLSGKQLPFEVLLNPEYLLSLLLFVIVLGVAAGSYPAFFLSSFRPAQVLKGKIRAGFRGSSMRNVLVTLQFVISIALITCTLVVQHQLTFMRSKKLGFDKENVLIIGNAHRLASQRTMINAIEALPAVQSVAAASNKPIDDYDGIPLTITPDKDNRKLVNVSTVDHDFLSVLRYEFVVGRNFSKSFASDSDAVILNEKAAAFLFDGPAEGKKVYFDGTDGYTVIGVVKDFNFESLKNEVRPLVFFLGLDQQYLHVRLNPGDYNATISAIGRIWRQQNSEVPFSYTFLDEAYNNLFKEEAKLGTLFSIFTGLALFIACLGLIGLAAYMAEQRKKEISVRKVLGATVSQVIMLISRDFMRLMIVAFILAVPFAYFVMKEWLDGFAYRIDVSPLTLFLGGIIVMFTALLAVSYQAVRAALLNPVDSLKEE